MKEILADVPWIGFIHATARLLQPRLGAQERLDRRVLRKRFIASEIVAHESKRDSGNSDYIRQGGYAWRARRPTLGFDARFALAINESPLSLRSASLGQLTGNGSVVLPPAIGALKRELLLLNGVVLVEFSRTVLCNAEDLGIKSLEEARAKWKFLSRHGLTVLFEAPKVEGLDPFTQSLFYHTLTSTPEKSNSGAFDVGTLVQFNGNNPFYLQHIRSNAEQSSTDSDVRPRLNPGSIPSLAFVSSSPERIEPVSKGLTARADAWGADGAALPFGLCIGAGAEGYHAMRLAARSLSHLMAHELLIKQSEALYQYHAGSIRDAKEWQAKQNACGKFLMNWQSYLAFVKDCWSLGYGDRFIDTAIVEALQQTIVTRAAWLDVSSRLDSLVKLSSEVLPDGEAGFLL